MLLALAAGALASPLCAADGAWLETTWHGERARVAESGGWSAVVSLDRARLVHFGPVSGGENLLFAPATRDGPEGWGGHRVWLGPQAEWPSVWPPPTAWEQSAAESVSVVDGALELVLPASGDGWARLTRVYRWTNDGLACTVRLRGGTRAAQVLQIMQVHAEAVVHVAPRPDEDTPEGFVVLQIGQKDQVRRSFPWPAGVTREADGSLRLRPAGAIGKLAFFPQALRAELLGCALSLGATAQTGRSVGEVDDGFTTQVYLGRPGVPFLEIEQLSSRFAPGEEASATVVLSAQRRP